MQKILKVIRILTIACYFMPFTFLFVTCNSSKNVSVDFAYNKKEAAENEIKDKDNGLASPAIDSNMTEMDSTMPVIDSSATQKNITNDVDTSKTTVQHISTKTNVTDNLNGLLKDVERAMIKPSETSETAVGIILVVYKTFFGKIVIGISLFISFIVFVIGCFKKHNKRLLFVFTVANLLCITAFVIDALANNVQVLYGAWLCFALIASSVMLQYKYLKSKNSS